MREALQTLQGQETLRGLAERMAATPPPRDLEAIPSLRQALVGLDTMLARVPSGKSGTALALRALRSLADLVRALSARPSARLGALMVYAGHQRDLAPIDGDFDPKVLTRELESHRDALVFLASDPTDPARFREVLDLFTWLSPAYPAPTVQDPGERAVARRRLSKIVADLVRTHRPSPREVELLIAVLPERLSRSRLKSTAEGIALAEQVLDQHRAETGDALTHTASTWPPPAPPNTVPHERFEALTRGLSELGRRTRFASVELRLTAEGLLTEAWPHADTTPPRMSPEAWENLGRFVSELESEPSAPVILDSLRVVLPKVLSRPTAAAILAEGYSPRALVRLRLATSGYQRGDDPNFDAQIALRAALDLADPPEDTEHAREAALEGRPLEEALETLEALPQERALAVALAMPELHDPEQVTPILRVLIEFARRPESTPELLVHAGDVAQQIFAATPGLSPAVREALALGLLEPLAPTEFKVQAALETTRLLEALPASTTAKAHLAPAIAATIFGRSRLASSPRGYQAVLQALEAQWGRVLQAPVPTTSAAWDALAAVPPETRPAVLLLGPQRGQALEPHFRDARQFGVPAPVEVLSAFVHAAQAHPQVLDAVMQAPPNVRTGVLHSVAHAVQAGRVPELGIERFTAAEIAALSAHLEAPASQNFPSDVAVLLRSMAGARESLELQRSLTAYGAGEPDGGRELMRQLVTTVLDDGVTDLSPLARMSTGHQHRIFDHVLSATSSPDVAGVAWTQLLHPATAEMFEALPSSVPLGHVADILSDATIPTLAEVEAVLNEHAQNGEIAHDYIIEGCYARAHVLADLIRTRLGDRTALGKMFAFRKEPGRLKARNAHYHATWWYHVAPVIYLRDPRGAVEARVLDFSFEPRPLRLEDWVSHFSTPQTLGKVELTDAAQFYSIETDGFQTDFDARIDEAWDNIRSGARHHEAHLQATGPRKGKE